MTAQALIDHYAMLPHPEGGWYKETYRSSETIPADALPQRFEGARPFSTAIYFLLEQGNFSAFHRIKSDECWHFYAGDPLEIFILDEEGGLDIITLGPDIVKGQLFQFIVPAGRWFASRPAEGSAFCFVGCTVAPGFDFRDFEMAEKETLTMKYPQHREMTETLCR